MAETSLNAPTCWARGVRAPPRITTSCGDINLNYGMCLTAFRAGNRLRRAMLSPKVRALRTSSGARARAAGATLAVAIASCSTQYPNPFENSNQMVPPPTAAKIVFTANTYATQPGGGHDLFAMEDTGAGGTRLTFCNTTDRRCDYLEAIPGPDRTRQAVRRALAPGARADTAAPDPADPRDRGPCAA